MNSQNCWEFKQCGREHGGARAKELGICSAATTTEADGINGGHNGGRLCWVVAGTLCKGNVQGTFAQKLKNCIECDFYTKVREKEGFRFDMGATVLAQIYSPHQLAQAYEQLHYTLNHMKELESRLFCEEKVASVGRLAAGVAHEINTPLSYVMNNLSALGEYTDVFKRCLQQYALIGKLLVDNDLLSAKQKADDVKKFSTEQDLEYLVQDVDQMMSQSMHGLCRIRDIINTLKSFSKVDSGTVQETDINEELKRTISIIKKEFEGKCNVVMKLGEISPIQCNPAQINQVFLNVLLNAAQAICDSGTITVLTNMDDDHIIIRISDTGVGLSEKIIQKIFDPFFTTKDVGQGIGLGLSVAQNVITNHGGSIRVESKEGQGSSFTIRLPAATARTSTT